MSRTDQVIGLTTDAEKYIEYLKNNYSYDEFYIQIEEELFSNEIIYGLRLKVYTPGDHTNEYFDYIEKVQMVPWNGGPMYLNNLSIYMKKRMGQYHQLTDDAFSWVYNPGLPIEIDYDKGQYNI